MKHITPLKSLLLALAVCLIAAGVRADDQKPDTQKKDKPIPYPLKTCAVCGMDLSDMGKPCVFAYKNQEIKVCDKSEKADFEKNPDKYMKPILEAEARAAKKNQ
jgi:nitrous oxide reductase accessory protein NosL